MSLGNAATIRVPEDQPTIQAAIDSAASGDVIDVASGTYSLPHIPGASYSILVNKGVTLVARQLYHAILDGSNDTPVLLRIQGAATIEGFILQNATTALQQRNSPNVAWYARNLILRNLTGNGVEVNDAFSQIGTAIASNVVVDNCRGAAFITNDARGIDVRNSVVSNCGAAFVGGDHSFFTVSYTVLFNNGIVTAGDPITIGTGVTQADPRFVHVSSGQLDLPFFSQCGGPLVDAGDPSPDFNDVSIPPSLGTLVGDIGAYGGPGAILMLTQQQQLDVLTQAQCIVDSDPPVITGATDLTVEATSAAGATVDFDATAVDLMDGPVPVSYTPASGSAFPLGTTPVTATATDSHGNIASANFAVTVQDTTAPEITVPAGITAEATSASGAVVSFSASAQDLIDGGKSVSCIPASGANFPIGETVVSCSATDEHGNRASKSFAINVRDTTAPSLNLPGDRTAEATGPAGAVVSFSADATDVVDGLVAVSCSPASGSTFALGNTPVVCSAADSSGNSTTESFIVKVHDTTAPALSVPDNLTAEATGPNGANVSYSVSANDLVDGPVAVECSPASGSAFFIGATTVDCSAADHAGNEARRSFTVSVRDTTPPAVTAPGNLTAEATGPVGAVVTFSASAIDLVDGPVAVTCSPTSGSAFPIGTQTVVCSATDAHGNRGSTTFTVTVRDTTRPTITGVPPNLNLVATSAAGAAATWAAPSATDLVDGFVPVSCIPASGSTFRPGDTAVICSATDRAGNTAMGSFIVTVTFGFAGFQPPINAAGIRSSFKLGSTVPVKFKLAGASAGISSLQVPFAVSKVDSSADPVNESISTNIATIGSYYRYDSTSSQYIYNWGTKGLATGTYHLVVDLKDGVLHTVDIDLR